MGNVRMLLKMGANHIPDKARQLRALYAWMWGWPGKKTLFMGGEFGQSSEWAYDKSLDWHLLQYLDHEGVRLLVSGPQPILLASTRFCLRRTTTSRASSG